MAAVDPRLVDAPATINEELLDRTLRHRVHLEQYAEGQVDAMLRLLRASEADVTAKLTARLAQIAQRGGLDRGPVTTARMRVIMAGLGEIIDGRYSAWADANLSMLRDLADGEARLAAGTITSVLPLRVEMALPSPTLLAALVTSRPFEGRVLSQWASRLARNERDALGATLQIGMVQGETMPQLIARVAGPHGVFAGRRHNAAAVTRTFVNHVSTMAHDATYRANDDIVGRVEIVATLDVKTTPICRYQDGRTYPVDKGPRPPFHYNCRTAVVPVLRSWRGMGIDLQEIPGGVRAARGTMIGPVPAKLHYAPWVRRQGAAFQRDVLGPTRYKLFRAGLDDVRRFATPQGRLYTLAELYGKHPAEAIEAGLIEGARARKPRATR